MQSGFYKSTRFFPMMLKMKIHPTMTSTVTSLDLTITHGRSIMPNSDSSYFVGLFQEKDKESLLLILENYHYEHQTMEDGGGTGEPFDGGDYREWFANGTNGHDYDPDKVSIVAKVGETVVGFLLLQTDDGMPELVGPHWAITDFFVDGAHRKHGLGRKLIEYASAYCISDGRYDILEASSVLSNKRASDFYLSNGFTIVSHGYEFLDRANHRGHGDHVVHLKKLN